MSIERAYWVYILANRPFGSLYVGITSDLVNRILKHREKAFDGHTSKYNIWMLVWFQGFGRVEEAIGFEKRLKRWRRSWKLDLIEKINPEWRDLWPEISGN